MIVRLQNHQHEHQQWRKFRELISSLKAVKGIKYYLHEITPDPMTDDSVWQVNNSSRCKFTFKELKPGQMYWVRVAALGTGLQKAYSYPAYKYVQ